MTLRLEIDCFCEYKCTCGPIPGTKITKQQIAYNLVRCNPALARYFSNQVHIQQNGITYKQIQKQRTSPYKSIVDQKNLRILLSDKHPAQSSPKNEDHIQIQINNYIQSYAQTSPSNQQQQKKPKLKKDPTEQELRQYYKQLKQTSRYLSDTAFRKYFNRQVFQNYGRQNTRGINDGIIYGNYLKTHNINPHTGENRPYDEQTFYHALISASPQKMQGPYKMQSPSTKQRTNYLQTGKNISLSRFKQNESLQKPLKKHQNNHDQIVKDNLHLHQNVRKYQHMKLSPKATKSEKTFKNAPGIVIKDYNQSGNTKLNVVNQNIINSDNIKSQFVNKKQFIQPQRPNLQKKINQNQSLNIDMREKSDHQHTNVRKQQIDNLSEIKKNHERDEKVQQFHAKINKNQCPVDKIKQNHMEHILSKECHINQANEKQKDQKKPTTSSNLAINFSPKNHKQCLCQKDGSNVNCKCCLDQLKGQLKDKAEADIDLSNRLITSARKLALYKNYALNNIQNAALNPHNYRNCCGQFNIS